MLVVLLAGVVSNFFRIGLAQQLSLANLQPSRHLLLSWRHQAPLLCAALYIFSYVVVTGLSLPGAAVLTQAHASSVEIEVGGVREQIRFDAVICAVGREARLSGYELEELGIPTGQTITTNAYLQTLYPNIYAAGDVAGPYQFTHTAAHQAWYAAVNALFGDLQRFREDHRVIPRTTFTDPEVASVALNEQATARQGVEGVTRFALAELDRAIVDSAETGRESAELT